MEIRALPVPGAWEFLPRQFSDDRGTFLEWFKADRFTEATGQPALGLAQANCSVSQRGVVRGVHFAQVPPSQAKYVTCISGAVLDVVVDIRVGSPTYRQWCSVRLDTDRRNAVYLSEGLGHAFMALEDGAAFVYLCSEGYAPQREHGVHPLDPDLGIEWPDGITPLLSPKDAAAPTLAQAQAQGLLPTWADCQAFTAALRER